MSNIELKERASNKAFAKLEELNRELDKYVDELKGSPSVLSEDQLKVCVSATVREIKTWNYIFKLIETDEKTR